MTTAFERLDWVPDQKAAAELSALAIKWMPQNRATYLASFGSVSAWRAQMGLLAEQELRRVVAAHFPHSSRVLNIGSGGGQSTVLLRELGLEAIAVDPVPEMCAMLAEACDRFGEPRPRIICAPAEALDQLVDVEELSFDGAIFSSSFHHLSKPIIALDNVRRLLRPRGAVAVVNEPYRPYLGAKARLRPNLAGEPDEICNFNGNERAFTHHQYMSLLREAGFTRIQSELNIRNRNYSMVIEQLAARSSTGGPRLSDRQLLARSAGFGLLSQLVKIDAARAALQYASVVQSSYVAVVPG